MKLFNEPYPPFEQEEITEFVNNSIPEKQSNLTFENFEAEAGWVYIYLKNFDKNFQINFSSVMYDMSKIIQFFAEIISSNDDMAIFPDYEGSEPILYAQKYDENKVRFLFAHDYELFLNDNVSDYDLNSYKIECDIIIDKKELLQKFYAIMRPAVDNYVPWETDEFNFEKAEKYLSQIKEFLNDV